MDYETNTFDLDGLAKVDTGELGQYAYKQQSSGFYLGDFHPDHRAKGTCGIEDDRHVFMIAGSRSGKGTSLIIPNLLRWPGGVFVIDPKGENAAITAMRRADAKTAKKSGSSVTQCLGQKVAILDPLNTVEGPAKALRVNYNPFRDINIDDHDGAAGEIETFCEAVVMPEEGSGAHFSETASTVLAGAIELALHKYPRAVVTWPMIRNFILDGLNNSAPIRREIEVEDDEGSGEEEPESKKKKKKIVWEAGAFVKDLKSVETPEGLAYAASVLLENAGPDERGSIASTLMRQLKWMNDRRMMEHLSGGDFSLTKAMQENWSIFVCIPPGMINRFRRWLRLMVGLGLDAKMQSPFPHKGPQTLFVLDEFAALGAFAQIETGAAYLAGYGVKLVTVIQNIGQLKNTYRDNWETFLGNSGGIVAWGLNDKDSEDYVADRLGQVRKYETSYSSSASVSGGDVAKYGTEAQHGAGSSVNRAIRDSPILWPHEVRYLGAREQMRGFVLPASGRAFTVLRRNYMEDDNKGLFDSPDFIRSWENSRRTT